MQASRLAFAIRDYRVRGDDFGQQLQAGALLDRAFGSIFRVRGLERYSLSRNGARSSDR
jgi:hypothetical protein